MSPPDMQAMGRMLQGQPQGGTMPPQGQPPMMGQGQPPQGGKPHENQVIAAARHAGADVEKMMQDGDIEGVIKAAVQADPSLNTPEGAEQLHAFLDEFVGQGQGQPQPGTPPQGQPNPQMQAMGKMLQGQI
jgi:hypothetical protein